MSEMPENKIRKKHPLIETLVTVKGNPKIVLFTEPLWGVPFSLFTPFVPIYMAALLSPDRVDIEIGLIASVFMLVRAITAIFAGAVTDKLGRKLSTFIFDTLSWTIPCLLWAFSQNFWWFVIGAAFNGLMQIPHTSWMCLLVEDAEKESLVSIFTLLYMMSQIAVIFAPLAAIMVDKMSIVPAMRIIYFFSFISMTLKFILLYKYGDETEVGRTRIEETKGMSIWHIMRGYGGIYKRIFASRDMILSLTLMTIMSIAGMITGNFFGLYVTRTLNLPEHYLAYFPILRAVIITVLLYFLQPRFDKFGFRRPMLIGLLIFITGNILLVFIPNVTITYMILPLLIIFIMIDAVAVTFFAPRADSLTQLLIEPSERARINGLMMAIVLGLSFPFGTLAGWLSDVNHRYPFILITGLLVLMLIVITASKKRLATLQAKDKAEDS